MDTIQLNYRLYQERDLPGILALWEKFSGWGGITEKQFRDWYLDAPYGECLVMVADQEDGELAGQMVFIPSQVWVGGRPYKALRAMAPILGESFRHQQLISPDHPILAMFRNVIPEAVRRSYRMIYTLPAFGWIGLMRAFPKFGLPAWSVDAPSCFQIPLDSPGSFFEPDPELFVSPGKGITEEYNELWKEATRSFPMGCSVVRNRQWLSWKLGKVNVLETRQASTGKLRGYVAVKDSGLVADALAATPEALKQVMRQTVAALHRSNTGRLPLPVSGLNGMYTSYMAPALDGLNPEFPKFRFAFGVFPLDGSLPAQALDLSKWYVMPND